MQLDTLARPLPSRTRVAPTLLAVAFGLGCTTARSGTPAAARSSESAPAYEIAYRVSMPNPASHLYEVQLDLGRLSGDSLRLQMPVWSPGRYARMDFARNVQDFAAETPDGRAVAWDKANGSLWRIRTGSARTLRVRYRVYANNLSGTFSVLDTAHANWNGPSLFMYVEGHKPDPVRLTVVPPRGWRVMNGAVPAASSGAPAEMEFAFPNYDVMADSPTEVAPDFSVDTFTADGVLYRIMVHHNGGGNTPERRARFRRDVEKIVRYENRVFGPPPISTYTFLGNAGYDGSDGMEHLTSTQIQTRASWSDDESGLLPLTTTASHEYFHVWNVKRVRPIVLGPFDYTTEQYQPSLWVAEGWTNYYGGMALHRGGVIDRAALYRNLAGVVRYNLETPGRKHFSARMSSFHAPYYDGAAEGMETNRRQTWITYYIKGEGLALLLDLEIRSRTGGARSLDHALRLLKERTWDAPNASYYLQGRGYTEEDVVRAVSDAAGADMRSWFDRYVASTDDPPFAETFARTVGVELVRNEGGYELRDMPGASSQQVAVREGWLSGK
ncbi:MAG TPA: hypothetical protein VKA84_29635 [Gemmatimonadaceae bacterium]|nr:hypothetical protein [Gemmatimonadaceae bacterium]